MVVVVVVAVVVRSRSRSGSSSRRRRRTTIVPSPRAPYCRKKPRLPLQKTPSTRYRRKKTRLPSQKTPTNACHLSIPRKKPSPHRRKKHPCGQYCHRKPFLRSPSQKTLSHLTVAKNLQNCRKKPAAPAAVEAVNSVEVEANSREIPVSGGEFR